MTIRCIYHGAAPGFPPSDQHPDALRYFVLGGMVYSAAQWQSAHANEAPDYVVDAIGVPPTIEEVLALAAPSAPVPVRRVERVGVARFTVAAGVVSTTTDTIGVAAVTRVSAGRYRIAHDVADPDLLLLPSPPYIRDPADVRARVTAKTSAFVEVRTVTAAGAAADVAEVILTLDKVITS